MLVTILPQATVPKDPDDEGQDEVEEGGHHVPPEWSQPGDEDVDDLKNSTGGGAGAGAKETQGPTLPEK